MTLRSMIMIPMFHSRISNTTTSKAKFYQTLLIHTLHMFTFIIFQIRNLTPRTLRNSIFSVLFFHFSKSSFNKNLLTISMQMIILSTSLAKLILALKTFDFPVIPGLKLQSTVRTSHEFSVFMDNKPIEFIPVLRI